MWLFAVTHSPQGSVWTGVCLLAGASILLASPGPTHVIRGMPMGSSICTSAAHQSQFVG